MFSRGIEVSLLKRASYYAYAFDRVLHAGPLQKLKSSGISGQLFGLLVSCLSKRRFPVLLDGESSQEYLYNADVPEGSILMMMLLSN